MSAALVAPPFQDVVGADLKDEGPEILESSLEGFRLRPQLLLSKYTKRGPLMGFLERFSGWK